MGLKSGVFIHLSHYSKNKETIHTSGKQDLYRVIKRRTFLLYVYILHLWLLLLKDMTKTNTMETFFFHKNIMRDFAKIHMLGLNCKGF